MKKILPNLISYIGAAVFVISTVAYVMCSGARGGPAPVSSRGMEGIIDVSELTPSETKRLDKILNSEVSPCGEDISLGLALYNPESCPLAPMAFDFIMGMLKEDYNVEEISAAYMLRYAALKGLEISVDGSPLRGPRDAAVTIVVFSDFQCPFCSKAAEQLDRVARAYPDHVEMVFKHYPLGSHNVAEQAARAAFAAHRQGKFWEMHDTLFSAHGSPLTLERMETMAVGLGLDLDEFIEDMGSTAATAALEADHRLGEELGVDGTPFVFVNGRPLGEGTRGLEERIQEEFIRYLVLSGKNGK